VSGLGRYPARTASAGLWTLALLCGLSFAACRSLPPAHRVTRASSPELARESLIPKPSSIVTADGAFVLSPEARIYVDPPGSELLALGRFLSSRLTVATGYPLPVLPEEGGSTTGSVHLTTVGADPTLGDEGYDLEVTPEGVRLSAYRPAGLFRGLQTIRQLLPASIEGPAAAGPSWPMACVTIRDRPRFAYRGAMLDVARHFFSVEDVESFIDLIAYYKMNTLHLHLSDDQGWRIAIRGWPKLSAVGGSTEVGGRTGALYYTQAQYSDIVAYARDRYVTLVPEIDMPGHTNAALASYAELSCNDVVSGPYTGTDVGFSLLCLGKPVTADFVRDVIGEIAALTPGPYFHMGGDETPSTDPAAYAAFVEATQAVVNAEGKRLIGWEEVANARLVPGTIVQQWDRGLIQKAVQQGAKAIFSPSKRAYLDMKYDRKTRLGQDWAGHISVRDAYEWDPATYAPGVGEGDVLGVEAPLWTETLSTIADLEYMAFPRLAGIAEIGWSPRSSRGWDEYRDRLGAQGPRLESMGVHFHRAPGVPWM
jgi:hexosaminidase